MILPYSIPRAISKFSILLLTHLYELMSYICISSAYNTMYTNVYLHIIE